MKFSEFKQACRSILDRIGAEKFRTIPLRLHDVESSSQFAQAVSQAASVDFAGGVLNIRPGRKQATLAEIISSAAESAAGLDPDMAAAGDRTFVFGYDAQQGAAVASYNLPGEEEVDESILDAPKPEMDPAVWQDGQDGPELTETARRAIGIVTAWAVDGGWIPEDSNVRVVGSIASNQYSDGSDIDVHFSSEAVDYGEDDKYGFNKRFKDAFEEFAEQRPDAAQVGNKPIEVFAQKNVFQDFTSAGCYDVKSGRWEVGPDVKGSTYDPYAEFYEDDMEFAGELVDEIRQAIMLAYEKAVVSRAASDRNFKQKAGEEFLSAAKSAAKLFDKIKGMRRAAQGNEPTSKEEALAKRHDRRWHIADSAFKLLGRLGYIGVCKACRDAVESGEGAGAGAQAVLASVSENIAANAALSEDDRGRWTLAEGDEIGGIPIMDRTSAEADIKAFAEDKIAECGVDASIAEVWLHGSRIRGDWKDESDLDAVVFYRGSAREDGMYGVLNDADDPCDVCGVPVDFNPIRIENLSDIDEYKARSAEYDAGVLAEGLGSALRAAALAGMTMAAGIAGGAQKAPGGADTKVPAAVARAANEPSYAGLSRNNMTNLLATIAYNEAMLDWMKDGNDDKIIAILNVIDNRAGKDPKKYASVISARSQFVSAKHVKGGYVDRTYRTYDPNDEAATAGQKLSPRQKNCWARCQQYARDMLDKKLPSKIGNRNMIANKGKDDAASYDAWGRKCDLEIGSHAFGYDSAHDPNAKKAPKEYVVKAGDTLGAIAKAHGMTAGELARKNGIKDPNKIRAGQKLKV